MLLIRIARQLRVKDKIRNFPREHNTSQFQCFGSLFASHEIAAVLVGRTSGRAHSSCHYNTIVIDVETALRMQPPLVPPFTLCEAKWRAGSTVLRRKSATRSPASGLVSRVKGRPTGSIHVEPVFACVSVIRRFETLITEHRVCPVVAANETENSRTGEHCTLEQRRAGRSGRRNDADHYFLMFQN